MKTLRKFIDKYHMLPDNGLILVAVSGGADSMCLLALMSEIAKEQGLSVAAVHYNHQLRGADSDRDADFVADYCRTKSLDCYSGGGDVKSFAKKNGLSLEEAARDMRYEFFFETSEKIGAERIATAHTSDDNAETVLLNLTRGSGLRGLCGIPPVRGKIIRPLLGTSRKEIDQYLAIHEIPYVVDITNSQDIYSRNKIRHNVIPVLKDINPNLTENIESMTELLRNDEIFINSLAEEFIDGLSSFDRISIKELLKLPTPVGSRVIRSLAGNTLTSGHIASIFGLCQSTHPSGEITLPMLTVYREYGELVFSNKPSILSFLPIEIKIGETAMLPDLGLVISCSLEEKSTKIHKSFTTFLFKYDEVCGNIVARPRIFGDHINLIGRNGTKSLKKLFIEEHIPIRKRQAIPVLADEHGVIAVYGIGMDKRVLSEEGDTVLKIMFEEII